MNETHLKTLVDRYKWRPLTNASGELTGEWLSCPVRIAFAHLAEPVTNQRGTAEYRCAALIPSIADCKPILEAAMQLGVATFGPEYPNKLKNDAETYKFALKRQTKLVEKNYQGCDDPAAFYFDAKSQYAPGIVGRNAEALSAKNENEVYSGMWCLLRVNLYAYGKGNPQAKKGVGLGLRAIQKIADDEVFKGGSATDVFGEIEALPGAASGPAAAPNTANAFDFV
jgi:hypothetical protein